MSNKDELDKQLEGRMPTEFLRNLWEDTHLEE
jgi:hypothetical protein